MKKVMERVLKGFCIGVLSCYILTIVISYCIGDGCYHPCSSDLIEVAGSGVAVVTFQLVLSGIAGAAFLGGTCIWQIDSWNLAIQSAVHLLITAIAMLPVVLLSGCIEYSASDLIIYAATFAIIWLIVWVGKFLILRFMIRKINSKYSNR